MYGGGASVRPRVLVIEDDRAIADIVSLVLQEMGCEARVILDPEDAGAGPEPDLVISDLFGSLPYAHGVGHAFASALRNRFPHVPLVILTADSRIGAQRDLPVDLVLMKPFDIGDLEEAVERFLDREATPTGARNAERPARSAERAGRPAKGGRDSFTVR